MQSSNLFHDDLGDLDALMSQMNSRPAATPPFVGFNPSPIVTTSAAPTPRWGSGQDEGKAPLSSRAGRRATVTIVEPELPLQTPRSQTPQPQATPVHTPPPVVAERRPSVGSWLDEDDAPPQPPLSNPVQGHAQPFPGPHSQPHTTASPPVSVSVLPSPQELQALEEERLLKEELMLLAEIRQVELDIASEQSRVETTNVKLEAELLNIEAQLHIKEAAVISAQSDCANKLDEAKQFHQRREDTLRTQQANDAVEADTAFRQSIASRMERSMSLIQQQIDDVHKALAKLENQKALVIGSNPHSVAAVSIAVDDGTLTLTQKLDLGVELVAGFTAQHLDALRNNIGHYMRKETTDAAHGVWEHHRKAFSEESTQRRSKFVSFLESAVSKFTAFMEDRQTVRATEVKKFRQVSEGMSAALRERWSSRTEERNKSLTATYADHSAAFDAEANSSCTFLERKFSAIQQSDESIERQRLADLQHRNEIETKVTQNLKQTEAETLSERNQRLQQQLVELSSDVTHAPGVNGISHSTVSTILQDIQNLHEDVCNKIRMATSCARLLHSDDSLLDTATEGFSEAERELLLLLREKRSVVESLSSEVKAQWDSLTHQRHHCGALRTRLAAAVEDEAAAVHDHRLLQASEYARLDMIRSSWEKEYQKVLGTATLDAEWSGLLSVAEAIAAKVAAVEGCSATNRRQLISQRRLQQQDEVIRCTEHQKLQEIWVALYDRILSLNDKIYSVSSYQTNVGIESAKLELERMTHEAQRDEFRAKFTAMEEVSQRVERDSAQALAMKLRTEDEVRQISKEHDAIILEQRKLSALQSELLQRQRDVMERKDALHNNSSRALPMAPHRSPFADLLIAA